MIEILLLREGALFVCICVLQGGGRSGRRVRPTRKVKEAEQSQRVASLVRKSIELEKTQRKMQQEKLLSLMSKLG